MPMVDQPLVGACLHTDIFSKLPLKVNHQQRKKRK